MSSILRNEDVDMLLSTQFFSLICLLVFSRKKNSFCPELLGVVACQLMTLDTSVQVTERLIFDSG